MGAEFRLIQSEGIAYTVRNATQGSDTRDVNSYSDDGTLRAVKAQSVRPETISNSDGEEINADEELRAVIPSDIDIYEPGNSSQQPTRLNHPGGPTFEVRARRYEDGEVDILEVVRV